MYLIIGGSGFLGRYLIKNILLNTQDEVIATYNSNRPKFENERLEWFNYNVQNNPAILADKLKNYKKKAKVIYLAAYHHPDKVEKNYKQAWEINIVSLAKIINALPELKSFFYASTDSVYGEGSFEHPFDENSKRYPLNLYGKQKALAEDIVLAHGGKVIRYPFIIGPSLVEGKPHFFDKIVASLENGEEVQLFSDSYRSTISFDQAAKFLIQLIENSNISSIPDVLNISSDKPLSKFDVGIEIAEKLALNKNLILPIKQSEQSGIFEARRPFITVLDNKKIKKLLKLLNINYEV